MAQCPGERSPHGHTSTHHFSRHPAKLPREQTCQNFTPGNYASLLYFNPSMATRAHVPWDEGVRLLQRGRVQLEEGGDVIAVGHGHQPVFDLLPRVPAAGAAAAPLHRGKQL